MKKYIEEEIENITKNINILKDLLKKSFDVFYQEALNLLRFSKILLLGDYSELQKENLINHLSTVYVNISIQNKKD